MSNTKEENIIMSTTKNQEIMSSIAAGDHQVIKSFYKKNLPAVRKLILKYYGTTEDVEDIFQEAMILLYHQLRYKNLELPKASVHTYFIGICKNLWRSQLRKSKPLEHLELIENYTKDNTEGIEETIIKTDKQELLRKNLDKLSNSSKKVLTLVLEGKSTKDIAHITGYSEGYTRKKRATSKKSLLELIFKDPLFSELRESPSRIIWN